MGKARRSAPEDGKGEAMIYKRGAVYWYKFRWTVKRQQVASENYRIRKSARTSNLKRAREVEEEHRRALRLGLVHPAEPWPKLKPQVPQIPTLREFTKQFLAYVAVQKKSGTARFYGICANRVLRFAALANALLSEITGEAVSKYAHWRRSTSADDSVLTVNGELRTLRRMLNLAQEWGLISQAPNIHELPGGKGRNRVSRPARARDGHPRCRIAALRVLLLASHLRHALCRERHGQVHTRPTDGAQLAARGGALLHPCDRAARDDRFRALPELSREQAGRCCPEAD